MEHFTIMSFQKKVGDICKESIDQNIKIELIIKLENILVLENFIYRTKTEIEIIKECFILLWETLLQILSIINII